MNKIQCMVFVILYSISETLSLFLKPCSERLWLHCSPLFSDFISPSQPALAFLWAKKQKQSYNSRHFICQDPQPIQYSGEAYAENAMGTTLYSMIACPSTYSCQLTVKVICAIVLFIPPQSSLCSGTLKLLSIRTLRKNHRCVILSWGFCLMC